MHGLAGDSGPLKPVLLLLWQRAQGQGIWGGSGPQRTITWWPWAGWQLEEGLVPAPVATLPVNFGGGCPRVMRAQGRVVTAAPGNGAWGRAGQPWGLGSAPQHESCVQAPDTLPSCTSKGTQPRCGGGSAPGTKAVQRLVQASLCPKPATCEVPLSRSAEPVPRRGSLGPQSLPLCIHLCPNRVKHPGVTITSPNPTVTPMGHGQPERLGKNSRLRGPGSKLPRSAPGVTDGR